MKAGWIFLTVLCCGVQTATAFEGRLLVSMADGETPIVYSIKGQQIRMEAGGEEPFIALRDLRQQTVRMLMPEEKVFVDVPLRDMSPYVDESKTRISRTGEKRTLHGYTCEKWVVTEQSDRGELWVTDQLGLDFAALWLPTLNLQSGWRSALGRHFPMKMSVSDEDGAMETIWEVTSIEKKRIDDALFAVPAGYRKMPM
jgi:hypothetical protein